MLAAMDSNTCSAEPTATLGAESRRQRRASLWSYPRYVVWLISDTSKGLAGTLFAFAMPLLTLMVTNNPAQAGVLSGIGMAANIATTLIGGILADRHSRLALMVVGSLTGTVISLVFTAIAWFGTLDFSILLLFEVTLALRGGIFNTAGEAALKDIVPAEAMGRAQAANQGRDAALQLLGNPLGGLLLSAGSWLVTAAMAASHAVSAITAALLLPRRHAKRATTAQQPTPAREPPAPAKNALRELKEGFSWLFSRSDVRGVLFVVTIINLGVNTAFTTAIYALQQDGFSTVSIGTVSSVIGVAMLAGAVIAPFLVPRAGTGILTIAGLVAITASVGALSFGTTPVAVATIAAPGMLLVPALNSGLMGYFMVAVPGEILGRANSAMSFLGMGALPLAPLIAGFGLAHAGRTETLIVSAAICAIAAIASLLSSSVRSLPAEGQWAAHAAQSGR